MIHSSISTKLNKIKQKRALKSGRITINNKEISINYKLKKEDLITHITHRHESPVSLSTNSAQNELEIIANDKKSKLLVINKPGSVAVHPGGRFRFNTCQWILHHQLNDHMLNEHEIKV